MLVSSGPFSCHAMACVHCELIRQSVTSGHELLRANSRQQNFEPPSAKKRESGLAPHCCCNIHEKVKLDMFSSVQGTVRISHNPCAEVLKRVMTVLLSKPRSLTFVHLSKRNNYTQCFYCPPNMLPKGIPPGNPPGNPPPLPGGGPDPAGPNFFASLSMIVLTLGLFSYLEMFSGFWLTSWKAAITSGSCKYKNYVLCYLHRILTPLSDTPRGAHQSILPFDSGNHVCMRSTQQ